MFMPEDEYIERSGAEGIREALVLSLNSDPAVYLIGEGVSDPKGIFGTTIGLFEKYGPDRVIETPVAENGFTATANGDKLNISGLAESFIAGFWGEPVIAGGTFSMDVAGNGLVTIPRQYIYTTTYGGAAYDYEISGSGTWTNCGAKPTLTFTYDIFYPGDAEGLAQSYASYLNGPYLGGTFTLN